MKDVARKESEQDIYDVVFQKKDDGSGCHYDEKFNKQKDTKYDKRNWLKRKLSP